MTPKRSTHRPEQGEYSPYYEKYIALVPAGDILSTLESQIEDSRRLLNSAGEKLGDHAYAPGKWSLKEVVGHLSDSERIFAYRMLRISRNDVTPIEGFEQDDYVRGGPFRNRTLADLTEDFVLVRRATLSLLRNLNDDAWRRRGMANKNEVTVRALHTSRPDTNSITWQLSERDISAGSRSNHPAATAVQPSRPAI